LGRDLADIQPGRDQSDRDVLPPAGGALDTHPFGTMRGEQVHGLDVAESRGWGPSPW
jgi:hypothetical protein